MKPENQNVHLSISLFLSERTECKLLNTQWFLSADINTFDIKRYPHSPRGEIRDTVLEERLHVEIIIIENKTINISINQ